MEHTIFCLDHPEMNENLQKCSKLAHILHWLQFHWIHDMVKL